MYNSGGSDGQCCGSAFGCCSSGGCGVFGGCYSYRSGASSCRGSVFDGCNVSDDACDGSSCRGDVQWGDIIFAAAVVMIMIAVVVLLALTAIAVVMLNVRASS